MLMQSFNAGFLPAEAPQVSSLSGLSSLVSVLSMGSAVGYLSSAVRYLGSAIWYLGLAVEYLGSAVWHSMRDFSLRRLLRYPVYLVSAIWYLCSAVWYLCSAIWYLGLAVEYLGSELWHSMRYSSLRRLLRYSVYLLLYYSPA